MNLMGNSLAAIVVALWEQNICRLFALWLFLGLSGCEKPALAPPLPDLPAAVSPSSIPEAPQTRLPGDASPGANQIELDACALITKDEVEAIQKAPMKETRSSARPDGAFRLSQCFYMGADFTKSVSLAVTQSDRRAKTQRTPREFWKETFGRSSSDEEKGEQNRSEKGQERREEMEQSIPPARISGIGEEAYWTGGKGGSLYVLMKEVFIRISVGGPDNEETKIHKSKALAEKALPRL